MSRYSTGIPLAYVPCTPHRGRYSVLRDSQSITYLLGVDVCPTACCCSDKMTSCSIIDFLHLLLNSNVSTFHPAGPHLSPASRIRKQAILDAVRLDREQAVCSQSADSGGQSCPGSVHSTPSTQAPKHPIHQPAIHLIPSIQLLVSIPRDASVGRVTSLSATICRLSTHHLTASLLTHSFFGQPLTIHTEQRVSSHPSTSTLPS